MKKKKDYQIEGIPAAGFQKWFEDQYPTRNLEEATGEDVIHYIRIGMEVATLEDYFKVLKIGKEMPDVTIFYKDLEKTMKFFVDRFNEDRVHPWGTLSMEERSKLATDWFEKCGRTLLSLGLVSFTMSRNLIKPLKKVLNKKYDTTKTLSDARKNLANYKPCIICGEPILNNSRNGLKKCCSPRCDSINRKWKRDAKRGKCRPIGDSHISLELSFPETCLICDKPLDGKRIDAKTCSPTCRKQWTRLFPRIE